MRSSGVGVRQRAFLGEDARLEKRLHQSQDAFVADAIPHAIQKSRMRDFVETGFDVSLHDPLIGAGCEVVHLSHRVMGPAVRAKSVGTRKKVRLEDRLQHQF